VATVTDVINYISSWRIKNGITDTAAMLTEGQVNKFAVDLQSKISELSFKSPTALNANIIAYNGTIDDILAWKLAKAVSQGSNNTLIYISDTPAGKLLNDTSFITAVEAALGGDETLTSNIIDGSKVGGVRTPYGVGNVLSVNDFVSEQVMAANAKGNVIVFANNITADSVLAQTEIPKLLEMTEVTSIDVISKQTLLKLHSEMVVEGMQNGLLWSVASERALESVRKTVSFASAANMDAAGMRIMTTVDSVTGKITSVAVDTGTLGTEKGDRQIFNVSCNNTKDRPVPLFLPQPDSYSRFINFDELNEYITWR